MRKKLAFGYGMFSYLVGLATLLYAIGFLANFLVPKTIDSGAAGTTWGAIVVDVLLVSVFAIQHSVMARAGFKRWWTRIVPRPVERSTFVLLASLSLGLIFWLWQPLPAVVWNVDIGWARWLLWGIYGLGWLTVIASAEMINGGHLFGRQQVTEYLNGQPLSDPEFQTPALYQYVRHPLMLGFILAFWATPHMTVGHLVFSLAMTTYILIGLQFEERALLNQFGRRYEQYREQVPMLIPRLSTRPHAPTEGREAERSDLPAK